MGLQPTASRTALLLACPRPFDPAVDIEREHPLEPTRYGSAFHQVIAACLRAPVKKPLKGDRYAREVDRAAERYDVRAAREELAGHVRSSFKVLRNWLDREKLEVADVEKGFAIEPAPGRRLPTGWSLRPARADDEHHYELEPGEVGGTVDLIAKSVNGRRAVVIDHKTGMDDGFARPANVPQMRTLGLAPGRQLGEVEVGIFHADRRGLPVLYAEEYDAMDRVRHADALVAALGRIGHGFLRPGAYCARCPARIDCPAHAADLLAESTAQLVASANTLADEPVDPKHSLVSLSNTNSVSVEARAGALYDLLKRFRALDKAGTEEIKRLVRAGAIIESREGGALVLQPQSFETLSKKSVLEALGKIDGERQLKRLRDKGAIREASREMLIVDKRG